MNSKNDIKSSDIDLLSSTLQKARKYDDHIAKEFSSRENEVDELENEIIEHYSNSKKLKLSAIADPIKCQEIFAETANTLSRITEIYNNSIKIVTKFRAARQTLLDALLPLMQGGSADSREAKARSCMEVLNRLIAIEEGLLEICESTQKNVKGLQEMASRQLKAIELDIIYFEGKESIKKIMEFSRGQIQKANIQEGFKF